MAEFIRDRRAFTAPSREAERRRGFGFLALIAGVFFVSAWLGSLALPHVAPDMVEGRPAASLTRTMSLCQGGRGENCVIDGDTFRLDGASIRIADIDTPESRNAQCAAEKALAERATARLQQLLNAGPFVLADYERDTDRYGRKLRIVTRNGKSLGGVLVAEGLARRWDGARHSWC
jgi:micrococcal nuclease